VPSTPGVSSHVHERARAHSCTDTGAHTCTVVHGRRIQPHRELASCQAATTTTRSSSRGATPPHTGLFSHRAPDRCARSVYWPASRQGGGGGQRSRRKRRGEPIAATAAAAAAAAAVGDGRDAETSAKEAAFTRLFIAPHMAVACAAPRKPAPRRNNGFYAALV